jgi:hypothetical protein
MMALTLLVLKKPLYALQTYGATRPPPNWIASENQWHPAITFSSARCRMHGYPDGVNGDFLYRSKQPRPLEDGNWMCEDMGCRNVNYPRRSEVSICCRYSSVQPFSCHLYSFDYQVYLLVRIGGKFLEDTYRRCCRPFRMPKVEICMHSCQNMSDFY